MQLRYQYSQYCDHVFVSVYSKTSGVRGEANSIVAKSVSQTVCLFVRSFPTPDSPYSSLLMNMQLEQL